MQAENLAAKTYAEQISEATGAPEAALPILEEIMRSEVFHSTLDWQTAAQLREGAREAYRLYLADQEFYDAHARWKKALFRVSVAEKDLASTSGEKNKAAAQAALEAARFEEAAARTSLDAL